MTCREIGFEFAARQNGKHNVNLVNDADDRKIALIINEEVSDQYHNVYSLIVFGFETNLSD